MNATTTPVGTEKKILSTNTPINSSSLKGGAFLTEKTAAETIFIANEKTEEQAMIVDLIREFCISEIQEPFAKRGRELLVTKEEDRQEVIQLLRKAGDLGLCGVSIPEEYGGMDLDTKTITFFSENIALGFSFATTLGAQTSIGSLPITYYGTAEQKAKYLPSIATGEMIAAYALTEPNAGSDANSGRTRAIPSADKTHYLLSGQKIWITNGGFAHVYIVFAKIEKDEKLSAFIVERDFEGFTVGPEEKKMGIKGSSTVQLYFDNCRVPSENLLGERGGGFKMALNILNGGRLKAGAGGVGGSKFALTRAIKYAIERKQFKQAISNFGAIQYKIGDLATRTYALDAAVYRTAHLIDLKVLALLAEGVSPNKAKTEAMREFAIEASIIKIGGSEVVCNCIDETLQIHGGMGYAVETGIEMAYRDARITKIYEGTNEINRLLSVGELGKRAIVTKEINLKAAGGKIPAFIAACYNPFASTSAYAREEKIVQGLKNTFLMLFGDVGKKMGKKLIDEQEIIMQLSDILADAFIAESVLLKIQKLEKSSYYSAEEFAIQKQMMQLYLYQASERTRLTVRELLDSYSSGLGKNMTLRFVNKMLSGSTINPKETRRKIARHLIAKKEYCF